MLTAQLSAVGSSRLGAAVAVWLAKNLLDPYRPELHYMRGPGPKWRGKHQRKAADAP